MRYNLDTLSENVRFTKIQNNSHVRHLFLFSGVVSTFTTLIPKISLMEVCVTDYKPLQGSILYGNCALRKKSEFFWSVFSCIRMSTEIYGVFSPNAGKYGPEKFRIQKLFTQWWSNQSIRNSHINLKESFRDRPLMSKVTFTRAFTRATSNIYEKVQMIHLDDLGFVLYVAILWSKMLVLPLIKS